MSHAACRTIHPISALSADGQYCVCSCDRLGELRMTVLSVCLDLTLSAHFMSDDSGSHCRMMSECPGKLSIFTAHIVANMSVVPFVSMTVDIPYPNVRALSVHLCPQHLSA